MRIALIADIHGNSIALNKILEDAKKRKVDQYFILGDHITDLPGSNEVLNRIKELTPYIIKGNRENYVIDCSNTREDIKWKRMQLAPILFTYNILSKENMKWIKSMPENMSLEMNKVKFLLVHGSPEGITVSLTLKETEYMDKVLKNLKEDILICGHSHQEAFIYKRYGKTVINPGCAGVSERGIIEYAVLEIKKDKSIDIECIKIDQDFEALKKQIQKSKILDTSEIWVNLVYSSMILKCNLNEQLIEKGLNLMNKKYQINEIIGNKTYEKFNHIDDDIYIEVGKEFKDKFML